MNEDLKESLDTKQIQESKDKIEKLLKEFLDI